MKKVFFLFGLVLILVSMGFVSAHNDETFTQAEEIIKQKISCENLTEEQLEILGDYYMEQMHPGDAHERMDAMMGGEGSESLKQIHINMGKRFYCGESNVMSMNMMNMMGNSYYINNSNKFNIYALIIYALIITILILFVILLIKQLQKPVMRRKN